MEQIEVNIKLASNNQIYNIPIRKLDTILKLKEYCQIISNIPPDKQNLIYEGKILSDDKLINDYNINNNHNIILIKKDDIKPINSQIDFINNKIRNPDNKEINYNEIANAFKQIPDISTYYNKFDINKVDNYYQSMGFGSISDIFGVESQVLDELYKNPLYMEMWKIIRKDPTLLEMSLNNPVTNQMIQKNPFMKIILQNPKIFLTPQNIQKENNMFKKDEKNIIESSKTGISVPPDPFESLNSNQSNQIGDSLDKISNINSLTNNNTGINIDYKEKYKDQLSQLKDMGFIKEEINIKALKQSNGNISNALEILLRQK